MVEISKPNFSKIGEVFESHKLLAILLTVMLVLGASGVVYAVVTSNKVSGETTVKALTLEGAVPLEATVGTPMTYVIDYENVPSGATSGTIHIDITNSTLGTTSINPSLVTVAITIGGSTTTLSPSTVGAKASYSLATTISPSGGSYQVSITFQNGVHDGSKYFQENYMTIP
ncbi:MAG: hypothetical protein ACPLY9_02070 [Nitrososphaerales archaeon]